MPTGLKIDVSFFTRCISLGMSVVFLYVNVVYGAIEPVKSIWEQRRETVKKLQKERGNNNPSYNESPAKVPMPQNENTLLAQLPSIDINALSTSFPKIQNLGGNSIPLFSSLNHETLNLKDITSLNSPNRPLPSWMKSIPLSSVSLKEMYIPPSWKPSDLMVIHIQDAHGNYEAQSNIARTLESLSHSESSILVGIEGARGAFNFHPYRSFPDKGITKEIANHFLKESFITGPEYVGMTLGLDEDSQSSGQEQNDPPITFWGIEDEELYLSHVQAFKDSVILQERVKSDLNILNDSLKKIKENNLNPTLNELDKKLTQHHKGKIGLGEYLKLLSKNESNYSIGKNVRQFMNALSIEESLDYRKIEEERGTLTRALSKKLPKSELKNLVSASLTYRLENLSHGAFYQYLKDLCQAYGIDITQWKEMDKYIRYVLMSEKIKAEDLFVEVETLEKKILRAHIKNPQEKDIIGLSKDITLIEKLIEYGLSPLEWETYISRKEHINNIPGRIRKISGIEESNLELGKSVNLFERFNEAAIARNEVLVKNLLNKVSKTQSYSKTPSDQVVVLVAGGFHTDGVTEILKKKRIAYTVLTPRLGKVEGSGTDYLDVFNRDKTPLEKLFTGERITINPQMGLVQRWMGKFPTIIALVERNFVTLYASISISRRVKKSDGVDQRALTSKLRKEINGKLSEVVNESGFRTLNKIQIDQITILQRGAIGDVILVDVTLQGKIDGDISDSRVTLEILPKTAVASGPTVYVSKLENEIVALRPFEMELHDKVWTHINRWVSIPMQNLSNLRESIKDTLGEYLHRHPVFRVIYTIFGVNWENIVYFSPVLILMMIVPSHWATLLGIMALLAMNRRFLRAHPNRTRGEKFVISLVGFALGGGFLVPGLVEHLGWSSDLVSMAIHSGYNTLLIYV